MRLALAALARYLGEGEDQERGDEGEEGKGARHEGRQDFH